MSLPSRDLLQATDRSTDTLQALVYEVRDTTSAMDGVRDNLALLTTAVKEANEQAKTSAASSSQLAKSLNRITFMLVVVGLIQVAVTVLLALHH
jgi:uncharacterized phage infection (PIP) family protein YhgE